MQNDKEIGTASYLQLVTEVILFERWERSEIGNLYCSNLAKSSNKNTFYKYSREQQHKINSEKCYLKTLSIVT